MQGISASHGIAYGQVFIYLQSDVEVVSYQVDSDKRLGEIARFEKALLVTRQQIAKIQSEVEKNLGPEEARIFDAHLLVLEDQALISETIREFESSSRNIETCFQKVSQRYIKAFAEIDDEYLRERAGDIRDVTQRVLQNLLGQAENTLSRLAEKRIVVANDLSPSDSASIDRSAAMAIVTETGSRTSHAVIVARSMKVPAVVGLRGLTGRLRTGDWLLVDGYDGLVILNPTEQTLFRYGRIQNQKRSYEQRLYDANRQPSVTLDGCEVNLMANLEKVEDTAQAREYFAKGVGLFRTEYLYLNSARVPTEQEQFLAYKQVAEAMNPDPVIIRSLDLGGDKPMTHIPELMQRESNPFLGFRAIRFCLETPLIFKDQLRAVLKASVHGKVKLMYPMISGTDELDRANAMLEECRAELRQKGIPFDEKMPVGAMIEIPSAAMTADLIAQKVDFFSIGTNDLIQYLLAIDRGNDRIAHLYEPTHPAVLRTLKVIIDAARNRGISVGVCGEMAGDPVYTALLLGLGIDSLSMTPSWLPTAKFLVRAMKLSEAKALAAAALTMASAKEIYRMCDQFYRAHVPAE